MRIGLAATLAVVLAAGPALTDNGMSQLARLVIALLGCALGVVVALRLWPRIAGWTPSPLVIVLLFAAGSVLGPMSARSRAGVLFIPMAGGLVLGLAYKASSPDPR